MTRILYQNGKVVGPVADWQNEQAPPQYKEVLGKTVLISKANDTCTFVSPKPVNRRDELTIIEDGKTKLVLQLKKVVSGLQISAVIKEKARSQTLIPPVVPMKKIDQLKMTAFVRIFTFLKLPLLNWIRPSVIELGPERSILKVPLNRRTKNHLGTMYFGALSMGGEGVVATSAVDEIRKSKKRVDFVFKEFHAEFLKRAEGDVHFVCEETQGVRDLITRAVASGERETQVFRSYAVVPKKDPKLVVAEFKVTLSVKKRG